MDDIKQDSRAFPKPESRISMHLQERDKFFFGFFSQKSLRKISVILILATWVPYNTL